MAHLTVYLPGEVEQRVRAKAKADGQTVNRWIAAQLSNVVMKTWSPEFLAAAGSDSNFELAEVVYGDDLPREAL